MHIHHWFGVPRWVLDSQTQVRQALEVYSGRPVYFSAFSAKTLHCEECAAGAEFKHDTIRRLIQVSGKVEGLSKFSRFAEHIVEGQFRLRQERSEESVWWPEDSPWEFDLRSHSHVMGDFTVEILAPNLDSRTDSRPRIKVCMDADFPRRRRCIVEGSSVLDRVVIEDETGVLTKL